MDRGAWRATVCEIARVRYHLVTKPPPPPHIYMYIYTYILFSDFFRNSLLQAITQYSI